MVLIGLNFDWIKKMPWFFLTERIMTSSNEKPITFRHTNRPAIALFNMHVPTSEIRSTTLKSLFRETMRNAL